MKDPYHNRVVNNILLYRIPIIIIIICTFLRIKNIYFFCYYFTALIILYYPTQIM